MGNLQSTYADTNNTCMERYYPSASLQGSPMGKFWIFPNLARTTTTTAALSILFKSLAKQGEKKRKEEKKKKNTLTPIENP